MKIFQKLWIFPDLLLNSAWNFHNKYLFWMRPISLCPTGIPSWIIPYNGSHLPRDMSLFLRTCYPYTLLHKDRHCKILHIHIQISYPSQSYHNKYYYWIFIKDPCLRNCHSTRDHYKNNFLRHLLSFQSHVIHSRYTIQYNKFYLAEYSSQSHVLLCQNAFRL